MTTKLNIKFSSPNLIDLFFEFVPYYKKLSYFAYYFNLIEEENAEEEEDNSSLCIMVCNDIPDYKYNLPQNIIGHFFGKYINLKKFCLFRFDDDTSTVMYEKYINGVKLTDNLIKCFYRYDNSDDGVSIRESFLYDLKNQKINDYEEIYLESLGDDNINSLKHLLLDNIEDDNYSLQVIKLYDRYNNKKIMNKKNFRKFIQNKKKFLFLREIEVDLTEFDYDNIFDSEELDILIKNLFILKLLEEIYIKINNSKIKLSKETSKLFTNMEIEEQINSYEKKILILYWKYNEK